MVSGTIKNAVKLDMLNQKWEQKKSTGDILSKKELKERENWTPEQRMMDHYQEQLEREKENSRKNEIANKISSGQKLSPEEEQYLASYDPQGLAEYRQTQNERKAYEEKLKNCKTKEEVQRLKTFTIGNHLSALKKIVNNPNIPISEKLKKAQQILGKSANIRAAEEEFIEEGKYAVLPSEEEQLNETVEESKVKNQIANTMIEESADREDGEEKPAFETVANELDSIMNENRDKTEDSNDAVKEMEDIYNRLVLSKQLDLGNGKEIETPEEKNLGKKMDFSV